MRVSKPQIDRSEESLLIAEVVNHEITLMPSGTYQEEISSNTLIDRGQGQKR